MKTVELFFWLYVGIIIGACAALSEAPNWALFDQRMSEKVAEYSTRFDFGSYDDKLAASYYDYANGMEYLSRRLNNPSLSIAAQKGGQFFADEYAIQYSGFVPGYWNFTDGLRRMYEVTGQERYKQAVLLMAQNAAFARDTTAEDTRQTEYSREVAYAIKAMLNAELLGAPRRDRLFTLVAHAQSHLEQWANNTAPYMRGFMFALTARSLIQYHDQVEPLGIRERIQAAADYWKSCCWVESARAFRYTDRDVGNPDDLNPQPDLNLLIAPVYAWLGDKEFAGKVFNGGIEQAWLGNVGAMKQFSQQLFWVERFENWIANSTMPSPTPTPTPTPVNTPTPLPTPCSRPALMNSIKKLDTYVGCRIDRLKEVNQWKE